MVRISILYDNTSLGADLVPDWGFAALVELPGRKVLFDAGADGDILSGNASAMNADLSDVDTIFVSHNHFDHIGGLAAAIRRCPGATAYLPPSLRGVKRPKRVVSVSSPMNLGNGLVSTGELDSVEQSLFIPVSGGYLLVVGCSHPGLERILEAAPGKVHAIVGGFHGFDSFGILEDIALFCPTHCTVNRDRIRELYPDRFVTGGAGAVLELS